MAQPVCTDESAPHSGFHQHLTLVTDHATTHLRRTSKMTAAQTLARPVRCSSDSARLSAVAAAVAAAPAASAISAAQMLTGDSARGAFLPLGPSHWQVSSFADLEPGAA